MKLVAGDGRHLCRVMHFVIGGRSQNLSVHHIFMYTVHVMALPKSLLEGYGNQGIRAIIIPVELREYNYYTSGAPSVFFIALMTHTGMLHPNKRSKNDASQQ
jgi:hypothetical protein